MKTIAVIDDDVHIGNKLEEILQKEGYKVLRAYFGTEAVYLLSKKRPDLVLLDLMLSGLNGCFLQSEINFSQICTSFIKPLHSCFQRKIHLIYTLNHTTLRSQMIMYPQRLVYSCNILCTSFPMYAIILLLLSSAVCYATAIDILSSRFACRVCNE